MKLALADQNVTLTGRFVASGSKAVLAQRFLDAGVTVTKNLGANTTALILGAGWNVTVRRAEQRGIPILTEAQAIEMLEQGVVELADAAEPDTPLDALIGEARSLLDGEPSAATWIALVALLDRCAPEHAPALADYLDGHLDRWEVPRHARLLSPAALGYPPDWLHRTPYGVYRVAPPGWVREGATGAPSPKHALARGLCFSALRHSNKELTALFEGGSFSGVTHLDLGSTRSTPLSRRALTSLATSSTTGTLRHLRVGSFKDKHVKALSADSDLSLDTLVIGFADTNNYDLDALRALLTSSWTASLKTLACEASWFLSTSGMLADLRPTISHLDRFAIDVFGGLRHLADVAPHLPPCPTLELRGATNHSTRPRFVDALDVTLHRGITTLDLSRLDVDTTRRGHAAARRQIEDGFLARLPTSNLCAALESVRLGHWHTDALAQAFDAQGITALDPPEPS
jgi:hypothetical protein